MSGWKLGLASLSLVTTINVPTWWFWRCVSWWLCTDDVYHGDYVQMRCIMVIMYRWDVSQSTLESLSYEKQKFLTTASPPICREASSTPEKSLWKLWLSMSAHVSRCTNHHAPCSGQVELRLHIGLCVQCVLSLYRCLQNGIICEWFFRSSSKSTNCDHSYRNVFLFLTFSPMHKGRVECIIGLESGQMD